MACLVIWPCWYPAPALAGASPRVPRKVGRGTGIPLPDELGQISVLAWTGGFIGWRALTALTSENTEVLTVSNLYRGYDKTIINLNY